VQSLPVVVREDTSTHDAIVTMFLEDCGTLFVVDGHGFLSGVVSRKDLLKLSIGGLHDLQKLPIGVVMTRMPNVVTVESGESVWQAAKKLVTHEVDAVPVVRRVTAPDGAEGLEVVGRFSKTNIVRLFVELGEST
jgi:CBS domain-containing protein